MEDKSEEQVLSRLFELEADGQSERRAELSGQRFISLIQDPDTGRGFILQHGLDETEGAEIPPGTEFYEYPTWPEAERAFDQLLAEAGGAGEVVEDDSTEGIGDSESGGAEVRDQYSADDDDAVLTEGDEKEELNPDVTA
ncbi:MAG TPA: hypothetical protein VGG90_13715 [Candidatus Dormibacteraeota bacterium]|jgi:hypothetical protein